MINTLKVKYARLPVINLACRYVLQVVEPVELVPEIMEISVPLHEQLVKDTGVVHTSLDIESLKQVLLNKYDCLNLTSVEVVECNLLTPKN